MAKFKRLFIAEKGTAGKALAEYLAKSTGNKLEGSNAYAKVGDDIVTWMSGHLLEQVDAHEYDPKYKKWRFDDLPIIPQPFVLVPKRDPKSRAREKIDVIGKLLKDCETVVGFGDPDSEGQLLQDQLLQHLRNTKPVMRLWCNSLDDTKLADALANMKPNAEYIGWFEAALARSQSDWLYGINMTRACAVQAQSAGADFQITVGRVQTPTLALPVERELAIRNFKAVEYAVPYIGLVADPRFRATWFASKDAAGIYEDPRVDLEGRLTKKADSDAIVAGAKAAGKATVVVANTSAGTENAPLPFALSSLQAHCSRLFGLSAKNTLEVAQSLYLKKLTSYPRVDCDFLPETQHGEAARILASISKAQVPAAFGTALRGAKPALKSRAWNDSKVTAHHAIIPAHLDNPGEIARLSDIELKVYFEIAKRYVLQFWPAAKFMATEVVLACGPASAEEHYAVKGRRWTDQGWRAAFTLDAGDEEDGADAGSSPSLPQLTKGQVLQLFEAGAESKKTTAPKRFTEGTLIVAMKTIHQYVKNPEFKKRLKEGVGIGTEATRASIIDGLIQRGFLTVKGKDLIPSDGAMLLIGSLPDIMRSPDVTAMWQQLNDDVMSRASNHEQFIAKLVPWLTDLVKKSTKFFNPSQFPNAKPRAGASAQVTEHKCFGSVGKVGCGSPLRLVAGQYGPFYGCSNEACKKTFRQVGDKPVEKAERPPEVPGNPKYACSKCKKGFLRSVARKDGSGSFWGCSNWSGGCKAIYNDANGEPDLEGKSKGGSGGGSGGGPKTTRSTGSRGRPSSYRSPTPTPT